MTEIHSAARQLTDLAAAMRPDWDQSDLTGALASAASSGWPWPKAFLATARLLADPKSTPRDLMAETRNPVERGMSKPVPPPAEFVAGRKALAKASADGAPARAAGDSHA